MMEQLQPDRLDIEDVLAYTVAQVLAADHKSLRLSHLKPRSYNLCQAPPHEESRVVHGMTYSRRVYRQTTVMVYGAVACLHQYTTYNDRINRGRLTQHFNLSDPNSLE